MICGISEEALMLIVAMQDDVDMLYAIYDTCTDRFLTVNCPYFQAIGIIMDKKSCSFENAQERVDHPQHFSDIVDYFCIDD